jgi:hypothetical protein
VRYLGCDFRGWRLAGPSGSVEAGAPPPIALQPYYTPSTVNQVELFLRPPISGSELFVQSARAWDPHGQVSSRRPLRTRAGRRPDLMLGWRGILRIAGSSASTPSARG